MSVKVSTSEMLLDALIEKPNVKAALLVDDRGYIIEQRGNAPSLKETSEDDATLVTSKGRDNIYLVAIEDDFLIVVFDEKYNFERLKRTVDDRLEEFDLGPESGPDSDD